MALALVVALAFLNPTTLELTPTDDAWVYPHASDPAKDPFLRVWGMGGEAVANQGDAGEFSYSYLSFDVSGVPTDAKLTKAVLVMTQIANPPYTADQSKQYPIEVRPLIGEFDEKTWRYDLSAKVTPDGTKDATFGTGFLAAGGKADEAQTISVDLLKGPGKLGPYLSQGKALRFALTSTLDPTLGERTTYKFYSKDNENKAVRPKLVLEW